jgi:hypothetical protein
VTDTLDTYCRSIEAHLCRKNGGHLVRIVGPAFDVVRGWAERGIPLRVAYQGIDRYVERDVSKGARRRPARIEFCEADVLDIFDAWRRAVGVPADGTGTDGAAEDPSDVAEVSERRRQGSLPAHVEKVIARLTTLRGGADRRLDMVLEAVLRDLDADRSRVKGLRGQARSTFESRLRELDARLASAVRAEYAALAEELGAAADDELAAFKQRMSADDYARAREVCIDRLLRQRLGLPHVTFE